MAIKLFDKALGLYLPSFFCMELNIPFDFEKLENNNSNQVSTFIHEYIHYIQDVTTTYGYINFCHYMNLIQLGLHKVATSKEDLIKVPISYEGTENAEERDLQMSIFGGDSEYLTNCFIDSIQCEREELYELFDNNENEEICKNIELTYHSNNKYNQIYKFGSMCIMESMAYLIESHIFSEQIRCNEFPYNTCEAVCNYMYPGFGNNKRNIVALCDVSLMTTQPGNTFCLLLWYMNKNKILPKDDDEIYELALECLKPNYIKGEFNLEINKIIEKIDYLYPKNDEITKKINEHFSNIIHEAENVRKNDYGFFSRIMNMDSNKAIEYIFKDYIKKFALPVIRDREDNVYMYSNKDLDLTLILASRALYEIFFNTKCEFKCYMYGICKKFEFQCNNNCISSPWNMVNNDAVCPFAYFWYRFSLSGKVLTKRDKYS